MIGKDNLVKKLGETYAEALAAYPKVHAEFEQIIRKAEQVVSATNALKESRCSPISSSIWRGSRRFAAWDLTLTTPWSISPIPKAWLRTAMADIRHPPALLRSVLFLG